MFCTKNTQIQIIASLPPQRATLSRPFAKTGLNYAWTFDIKNFTGRACFITKGYIFIFVSFATKANQIWNSKWFICPIVPSRISPLHRRRGCPALIYSDNGKIFVIATELLRKLEVKSLISSALLTPDEPDASCGNLILIDHWKRLKVICHSSSQRLYPEYLVELYRRCKWKVQIDNVKISDLVVILNNNLQPNEWQMGKIIKTYRRPDGNCRVVYKKKNESSPSQLQKLWFSLQVSITPNHL